MSSCPEDQLRSNFLLDLSRRCWGPQAHLMGLPSLGSTLCHCGGRGRAGRPVGQCKQQPAECWQALPWNWDWLRLILWAGFPSPECHRHMGPTGLPHLVCACVCLHVHGKHMRIPIYMHHAVHSCIGTRVKIHVQTTCLCAGLIHMSAFCALL